MEEVRQELIRIFADPEVTVRYEDDVNNVSGKAPDKRGFPPLLPPPGVLEPLTRVAAEIWPGAPVIPEMDTGASDSVYTRAENIPSYGVNGIAIDQDDVRAHGKDERVRVSSFYDGVEFHYRFLKALTSNR